MSRLTYELSYKGGGEYEPIKSKDLPVNNYIACVNKLGRLEDLEEELGCPLEVVFKALKEGFWFEKNGIGYKEPFFKKGFFQNLFPNYKNLTNLNDIRFDVVYGVRFCYNWKEDISSYDEKDIINPYESKLKEQSYAVNYYTYNAFKLSDYKKTWWLKEDKSE